jgi:hypothetical protein
MFKKYDCLGRDNSEELSVDGKIISEWIIGKQGGKCVDCMHLAQDRDQ